MKLPLFQLEDYFAEREFSAQFVLCGSDLETHSMEALTEMADEESLSLWHSLQLHYTETKGLPLLRKEIAKLYGSQFDQEKVLCFAGAGEGIYCVLNTLLERGDHAVVVTPCYQSLEALPTAICAVTKVELEHKKGWKLDVSAVEAAVQPNTKLLIINFPHNPTGALVTREQQRQLIDLARKRGIWIFSDEVYRLLELNPEDRLPPMASEYERGLSLSVMSKAYGLAGLRIGWVACQNGEVLAKIAEAKHYLSLCNSAPSEILSLMALRASKIILSRNMGLMHENLTLLERFFEEHAKWFEWVRPRGGCIGFPRFNGGVSIDTLAEQLLEETGVLIAPGRTFNHSGNHFRISFGRRNMPEALERFDQFMKKWKSG